MPFAAGAFHYTLMQIDVSDVVTADGVDGMSAETTEIEFETGPKPYLLLAVTLNQQVVPVVKLDAK